MRYQSGEYVVYRNWNICKVEEVTNKCFDGESTVQYLELRPTDSNGIIYVPLDKLEKCIRPILTQTELLDIIDSLPNAKCNWIMERNKRIISYNTIIKSGDYSLIIPIIKALYNERQKRISSGKHLSESDEAIFNHAKHLFYSEISYSSGISPEMVEHFIEDRLNK